jgi:ubiquinone/menaquinone biosynthesis C-methylase UbiE
MYDERSEQYDDNDVHIRQARDYVSWAGLKPGESVLDLACGTGLVTLGAKREVGATGRVVGIDISDGMLNVARRKADTAGLEVSFENQDISDLTDWEIQQGQGPPGGLFDVITCASALILLQDPVVAVRSWKTRLRPTSGRFIMDVQTKDANVVMNIFAAIAPQLGESVPWDARRWHALHALEQVAVDAGLKVEKAFETQPYAVTHYEVTRAPDVFRRAVEMTMFKNFGQAAIRERAEKLFVDKYAKLAGPAGTIIEECRYWVILASNA